MKDVYNREKRLISITELKKIARKSETREEFEKFIADKLIGNVTDSKTNIWRTYARCWDIGHKPKKQGEFSVRLALIRAGGFYVRVERCLLIG